MTILQNIIFPQLAVCTEEKLYFRLNTHAYYNYEDGVLILSPGGQANFNTYFNQFSSSKWAHYSTVQSVILDFEFKGDGLITVELDRPKHSIKVLAQKAVSSKDYSHSQIELPILEDIGAGLISFKIQTHQRVEFKSARFLTTEAPGQDVVLGIAITAFRRDQYVLPALDRLHRDLLSKDAFKDQIKLVVVDNGGTLADKDIPATCKVIPNRNLGGAGGFSRGLFHFDKETDGVSHCLFMDDDASCETEAIIRTLNLLGYARDSRLAVAGAMMLERVAFLQHENGAFFDMRCIPLKNGLDLRSQEDLLKNDEIESVGYGAWWYFAFPISGLEHYPFPFFVRGDDVSFSMANNFEIATLNGVCSWQESFAWKNSPQTAYLDMRSNITQYFLTDRLDLSLTRCLIIFWYFFLKNNLSYHYASAEAMCISLQDVLGPASFWQDNIDMSDKRSQLAPLVEKEKLRPMIAPPKPPYLPDEKMLVKLFRWMTLNGHLLPVIFFRKRVTLEKIEGPFLRKVFAYREVNIYYPEDDTGCTLTHSKRYFFKNLFNASILATKLLFSWRELQKKEVSLKQYMTSEFWRDEFGLTK